MGGRGGVSGDDVRPLWFAGSMAIETSEIERVSAMVRSLAGRDVSALSKDQLLDAHHAVATLSHVVQALSARLAGEVARRSDPALPGGGRSRQQGSGNASQHVQRVTGASPAGARNQVEAGDAFTPIDEPHGGTDGDAADAPCGSEEEPPRRRVKYPFVADAQMVGDLSVDAAGMIVAGLNDVRDAVSIRSGMCRGRRITRVWCGSPAFWMR